MRSSNRARDCHRLTTSPCTRGGRWAVVVVSGSGSDMARHSYRGRRAVVNKFNKNKLTTCVICCRCYDGHMACS